MIGYFLIRKLSTRPRLILAGIIFDLSIVAWPSTHALMVALDPAENTWVFHVLLGISWLAITFTAVDILQTADVRHAQDGGDE